MYMKRLRIMLILLALSSLVTSCGGQSKSQENGNSGGEDNSQTHGNQSGGNGSNGSTTVLPTIDYVKVFAKKSEYSHVYAWTESGSSVTELVGKWPGTKMTSYDDTWNTYDFRSITAFNIIFNNSSGSQTDNLSIKGVGHYWCINNQLTKTDTVPGTGGSSTNNDDGYVPPSDIPQGDYTNISSSSKADDLPAVKNFTGTVVNKYTGTRTDFRDESIYFCITTRFYDGDKSNNRRCWDGKNNSDADPEWRGDFKGLIQKMDYIKALGFTAIWITPIVKNASGYDYHGYHAINFKEVDPRYLSEDVSFQTVINEAHKRDMKIVLDVVFNHTGNFGEENLFPMFYYDSENNSTIKGMIRNKESGLLPDNYDTANNQYDMRINAMKGSTDVNNIYHHEKQMAYEQYIEQTGQMAGDCVDLNTENPTVANYLIEAYGEFIRMGVDAFRIDTMKHISRLTFNYYLWPGLYSIAKKCGNTNFFMFGEVCTRVREVWNHNQQCDSAPFYTWKESKEYPWGDRETNEASTLQNWNDNSTTNGAPTSNNAYLNSGLTYHTPDYSKSSGVGVIDFPMHWNFQHASEAFNLAKGTDKYYNDATYNVTYVDSHDYGPDGAEKVRYKEGTNAWKENMALLFTFRGIPCIYYGSEIEFQKGKIIDDGPNLALENSGRAYFGDHIEGSVTPNGFGAYSSASGAIKKTLDSTLSKHLQKLSQIRLKTIALRRGQYTTSGVTGNMAFIRRYNANGVDSIACVTISGGSSFSGLPNGTYKDLYNGTTYNVTNGSLSVSLSGQGSVAIIVKQ